MKKISLWIGLAALVGVMAVSAPAWAGTYINMQGGECKVEVPGNNTSTIYYGWGLDFTAKANTTNWVHCQLPTQDSTYVRYVRLYFYTSSSLGRITRIDVYSGPSNVRQLTVDLTTTGGYSERIIDLGTYYNLSRGLGLSFRTTTGGANTRYIFGNVAYFDF